MRLRLCIGSKEARNTADFEQSVRQWHARARQPETLANRSLHPDGRSSAIGRLVGTPRYKSI